MTSNALLAGPSKALVSTSPLAKGSSRPPAKGGSRPNLLDRGAVSAIGSPGDFDKDACYGAMLARDARFDGLFYVAVRTTGVYCRPICPARTPGRDRCTFYRTGAEAERDGYRACFRCRPELAPGSASVDSVSRIVGLAMARIQAGALNDGSLEDLAAALGVTERHLRRSMKAELGISPVELAQSRRLALARQLVRDGSLPITDVAFASGFRSVRRFNALFRARCGRSPSEMRRARKDISPRQTTTLRLDYRPPYDWEAILAFLAARAIPGVELVEDGAYARTVRVGALEGWLTVSPAREKHALTAEVSLSLVGALMPIVARLRRLFDLDAQPKTIARHLGRDARLARLVSAHPGLRVPGAFDGFESAIRAVLGQQVSVVAARTLAGRLAARFGARIETPIAGLTHLSPPAERVADLSESDLARLVGMPGARARTLRALARAVAESSLDLEPGVDPERIVAELVRMPGIGVWTAHYVAMRALGWPDAFPEGDLGVRKALAEASPGEARALAERWRPWRAYAVMHLWTGLSSSPPRSEP